MTWQETRGDVLQILPKAQPYYKQGALTESLHPSAPLPPRGAVVLAFRRASRRALSAKTIA